MDTIESRERTLRSKPFLGAAACALLLPAFSAPADLKPDPFPGENIVTHTKLPSTLTYDGDGTRVTVHFEGRVPPDPARPLVAWLVTYQVPWTPANAEAMAKAALARYGTPSNAPNTLPMQWCARPNVNTGIGCPADDARL